MSQHNQHPNAEDSARCAALTGSVKSRYWQITRAPENQRQFPGEYKSKHMMTIPIDEKAAQIWASVFFPKDKIVKVELWPDAPLSPNVKLCEEGGK